MFKATLTIFVALLFINSIFADVYMHAPRGGNDRNCERNENRNNGNRLFDSQNNAKGGYACPRAVGGPETVTPRMYYYVGSKLKIEWTSQHSCGNPNNNCEVVLQYMCADSAPGLRDGTPNDQNDAATDNLNANNKDEARQGSHETYEWYQKCETRDRNLGLFIADQKVGTKSKNTRQNPNGNKSGWECPEERDYYPYWHPTPWRDIAILTGNVSRCAYYQAESQNVKSKGECYSAANVFLQYNNRDDCVANKGTWQDSGAWGMSPPECLQAPYNRDNHLGNGVDGDTNAYWWTIPNHINDACVFRLRYNISTTDYGFEVDSTYNGAKSPVKEDPIVDLGLTGSVATLELALNTDQYGRTFQDRSYVFSIRPRPGNVPYFATIYNLGLRGKRGNIVQTYPAVEYDYTPQQLSVKGNDYIHFQWVGSDYNPDRNPNNAEGGPPDKANPNAYRADRSNIIQADDAGHNMGRMANRVTMFMNELGGPDTQTVNRLAFLDQPGLTSSNPLLKCMTYTELLAKNNNNKANAERDIQNCMKLNNAPTPYFDGGLVRMRASGTFKYTSSRNNNFSNRSQKGIIVVTGGEFNSSAKIVFNILFVAISLVVALL
jgi:hypothetical protein